MSSVTTTIGGVTTTVYIGNYFEITSGITRTYYYAGSVRVAERYSSALHYLLTDQLSSTAVTTDASGNRVTELRYFPYGDSALQSRRADHDVPVHGAVLGFGHGAVLLQRAMVRPLSSRRRNRTANPGMARVEKTAG